MQIIYLNDAERFLSFSDKSTFLENILTFSDKIISLKNISSCVIKLLLLENLVIKFIFSENLTLKKSLCNVSKKYHNLFLPDILHLC